MLFEELFTDSIAEALSGTDYRHIGSSFYINNREAGIVLKFSFDVRMNGSDFSIYGGVASLCEQIELWPNGQLSVCGYDVSTYASRCGMPTFSNENLKPDSHVPRRYSKALLSKSIRRNMDIFKEQQLPDILAIKNLDDYYHFTVKADGFGYYVPIPFPNINSFFLCIHLGKYREAGHVYLMMLQRRDENVHSIDRIMKLPSKDYVYEALDKIEAPADRFARLDMQAKAIEDILAAHSDALNAAVVENISASRSVCDSFFE